MPGSTCAGSTSARSVAARCHRAKSVNAAFIGTNLDLRLRRLGASTIVLFGISTDMCVSTSARVGANLGYHVFLVHDACDCFDLLGRSGDIIPARLVHDVHVATLQREFATVVTTDEAIASLSLSGFR